MTVDEAKTKICPFMSGIITTRSDWFKNEGTLGTIMCRVDKCMAWEFYNQCASGLTTVKSTTNGYCKRIENE